MGFSVVVGATWKPQENAGFTAYWGTVTLRATGEAIDAFVDLLAKLYGTALSSRRMLPEVVTQAVGLATDPRKLMSEPAKMKLFFHSEVEDRYAEVFLNVDRPKELVQFHEKIRSTGAMYRVRLPKPPNKQLQWTGGEPGR